jgi:O-antigen/teichoic acid export membrane protein
MSESPVPGGAATPGPPLLGGYARGVAWTYLSVVLTGASTFFLAAWSVRRVGTAEYGVFALVAALAALLMVFDYAMGLAVQRAASRVAAGLDVDEQQAVVHAAHGAYALLGVGIAAVAGSAAVLLAVAGLDDVPRLPAVVVLLGLATALQVGTAALPAVAAGCRRFSVRSGASIAGVAVRVAVALLTVGRFGVAGLGMAQVAGVVADRLVLLRLLGGTVPWFAVRPARPRPAALRTVAGFAFPLLVLNLGAQLFAVSDLVAVGAFAGKSAVGVYQLAALLPIQVGGFLMIGYNVAFPALSGSDDPGAQEAATAFLTRVFVFVGGAALALAGLLRADVVEVVLGRPSDLAEDVVGLFCAIGVANLTVHGLASLLIARGHQAVMARVVSIEFLVNVILTILFVVSFGAVGAAVATLATVVLMDFLVFPVIARGRFIQPVLTTVGRHGAVPALMGAAVAAVAASVATPAGSGAPRLAVAGVVGVALAAVAGLVMLGPSGRTTLRHAFRAGRPATVPAAPVGARP